MKSVLSAVLRPLHNRHKKEKKKRAQDKRKSGMVDESNIVDASEPANAPAIAAIDHNEEDGAMSGLREIKYDKDYVRNRKRTQTKTKASTLLFERASQKESAEGELVLQSLVAKLEERLGLVIASPKLKSLVPSFPLDVDHCSVFGPRSHISRLIQNEVEALNATNEDAGKARALLLQLWDKRVAAAVEDCRRRKISFEALNLITQTNDKENDSHLLDKYDELKTENLHEAVTYLLHSNKMLAASIEAIELLLEHKFYWDAAVLARRYLTPSNETFKKVFTQWAKVLVHKAMSNFGDAQNTHHGFMIDAAKCYIVMDMYAKAAKHLAKSNDLKSLLLACRLSRIDVKTAELKGDSDAIEAAKRSASEVGDAAIRRCVVMCEWDLAAALIELMQLGQVP
uniref:Gem-associated protein 5 TPR domain-containing protein n=1 Tax=Plectus sambesii TaxID=2011161 RepID=A0A914UM48_9BILA